MGIRSWFRQIVIFVVFILFIVLEYGWTGPCEVLKMMARLSNRSIENFSFQLTSKRKRHFFFFLSKWTKVNVFVIARFTRWKLQQKSLSAIKCIAYSGREKKVKKIRYINRLQSSIMVIIGSRVFIYITCDYTWFVIR